MGFSLGRLFAGVATGGLSEVLGGSGGSGGGGGGNTSTNIGQDSQVGASEQGQSALGSNVGRDNAIVLGTNSNLKLGGFELSGSNLGNITIGDPAASQAFASTIDSVTEKNNATISELIRGTVKANIPNAATDLTNASDKAVEATTTEKIKPWLPLVAAFVLAWFLFRGRK